VAATDSVNATNWNGVILAVNKALYHTGTANIALSGVAVGGDITYYSTISSGITSAWNAAGTGSVVTTTDDAAFTSTNTVSWANSIGFAFTVTFSSADQMRYYFNAGGKVKLSLTGPAGTGRNQDWRTLCTAIGTIVFGYNTTTKSGGSGSPTTLLSTAGNGGFWGPHTSGVDREDFLQYSAGSAYTDNYISIDTKVTGATGSNGGKGVTLTFTINLVDDDTNIYAPAVASGTVASLVLAKPDSGSLDTSVWGTITTGVTKTTDAGTTTAYVVPSGSQTYTTAGDYTFTVPANVTSLSIFCIARGGTGGGTTAGGGGGGSAYIASLTVTPGQDLYLRVGGAGDFSGVSTTTPIASSGHYIVALPGGSGTVGGGGSGGGVAEFASAVGGTGGTGGPNGTGLSGGPSGGFTGGGGAAGYGGTGGRGGFYYTVAGSQIALFEYGAGSGGTGGGGSGGGFGGYGGGGVGLLGIGSPGAGGQGAAAGRGGSGGANAVGAAGGQYGGGGGSGGSGGGGGAVRIIWGPGRSYPSQAA
jgi:hypothetical protein